HVKAPELVHGLRTQTQVRAHGYVALREETHDLELIGGALELDHLRAAVLHEPHGVGERLLGRRVTHEGHVGDQEGAVQSLRDCARMIDDVVHRHRHGAVVTLDHHT